MRKLSVSIMTHPNRLDYAKYLKSITGGNICGINKTSLWDAAKDSWNNYDPNSEYHMVIQDDVIVHESVIDETHHLLDCLPSGSIISLSANRSSDKKFKWRTSQRVDTARALIIPTNVIKSWLEWDHENVRNYVTADDIRLTLFLIKHKKMIWYINPPIVKQRMDIESIYNKGKEYKDVEMLTEEEFWNQDWSIDNSKIKKGGFIERLNLQQLFFIKEIEAYPITDHNKIGKHTYEFQWESVKGIYQTPTMVVIPNGTNAIFPLIGKTGNKNLLIKYQIGISGGHDPEPVIIEFEDSHEKEALNTIRFWFKDKYYEQEIKRVIGENPRIVYRNKTNRPVFLTMTVK